MTEPMAIDWTAVAAGLVAHRNRRYFPHGSHFFPAARLQVGPGDAAGLLVQGARLNVPLPPERLGSYRGVAYVERGERPAPSVGFDRVIGPKPIVDEFERLYLHRGAGFPTPDLRLYLVNEAMAPVLAVALEAPLVQAIGFQMFADGMSVSEGLLLIVSDLYVE